MDVDVYEEGEDVGCLQSEDSCLVSLEIRATKFAAVALNCFQLWRQVGDIRRRTANKPRSTVAKRMTEIQLIMNIGSVGSFRGLSPGW